MSSFVFGSQRRSSWAVRCHAGDIGVVLASECGHPVEDFVRIGGQSRCNPFPASRCRKNKEQSLSQAKPLVRQEFQRDDSSSPTVTPTMRLAGSRRKREVELRCLRRHADLRLHQQQPVDKRVAHQLVVLQRELHVGRERKPNGYRLHHQRRKRTDGLAGIHVHVRCRRQHDHVHPNVDRKRLDLHERLSRSNDWCSGENSCGTILAKATYTYDALDNRIGMDENGTDRRQLHFPTATITIPHQSVPLFMLLSHPSHVLRLRLTTIPKCSCDRRWPAIFGTRGHGSTRGDPLAIDLTQNRVAEPVLPAPGGSLRR